MFSSNLFIQRLHRISPVRTLLLFYFIAVIFSTTLLLLPVAYQEGVQISLIDTIFTAVSALSVTGLSTVTIADTFSTVGVIFIAIILQLGAVGVMAMGTLIWLLLGRKIGLKERRLIMTDQNQTSFRGMVSLIKQIIFVVMTIELISFIVLGTYYLQYFSSVKEAYLHGFFGTISAFSNGAFDITGESLIPFKDDYFIQFMTMLLIILGAIGFPVLIEVKEFLLRRKKNRHHFTLYTKLTTATFFILIIVGALFIYLFVVKNFFVVNSWIETLFYTFFHFLIIRSVVFSKLIVKDLTNVILLLVF